MRVNVAAIARKSIASLALAALLAHASPARAQVRIDERVDVARVLVDVRVTNARGEPIRGLGTEAFKVELDGTPGRLESATWVGLPPASGEHSPTQESGTPVHGVVPAPRGAPASTVAPGPSFIPRGRLLVFLFQHSLEPSRIGGLLRMMRESSRFVETLQPGDRAAVAVFDTRLRLWQDFTANTARLKEVLGQRVLLQPPADAGPDDVSLGAVLDPRGAARAATPEAALQTLAAALGQISGPKSVVLFGHGFGTYRPVPGTLTGRAKLGPDYERARAALVAAQTTVFAIDVTDANEHTLETGLMATADDTGGFYVRIHEFEKPAMDRLQGALEGYYLLAVETPPGGRQHHVKVHVTAPGATVLVRRYSGG